MMSRAAAVAVALGLLAFTPAIVFAQDAIPPMPDAGYGLPDPSDYQNPGDLNVPQADVGPTPNSVTIPVPGGGQVTVEGPDAPEDKSIPNTPGGQWGVQQQTPNSQGVGPLGP